jgi:glucosamine--fructose-6-phosphate aminotransferase (isomerizing)
MTGTDVQMAQEMREAPQAIELQERYLARPLEDFVTRVQQKPPTVVVTCARGSSAHAATMVKHLIELYLGIPVAAAAPSIVSIYGRSLQLNNQLFLAVSQSGRSEDLIEAVRSARKTGALTVGVVNDPSSPLAEACELVLPVCAGPESSVAATKTFIATCVALVRLTALWARDDCLTAALARFPQRLRAATELDWSVALPMLTEATGLATIGRGPTLGIAREAALKLKETCNKHAEAFSGAEFLHGPVALASIRYPVLMFMPGDAAGAGMRQLAIGLRQKGTVLLSTGPADGAKLPTLQADHPELDAICLIQSFYGLVVQLAKELELDVDRPRHLSKVTSTT